MNFKYGTDDVPPPGYLVQSGISWAAVLLSYVVIIGLVVSNLQYSSFSDQVYYIQKLLLMTAFAVIIQVIAGHRLPVIFGPATVLLIGIVSSQSFSTDAVYSAIIVGGIIGLLAGASGLLVYIARLFTKRVVTVVLMLIVFTMVPTLAQLLTTESGGTGAAGSLLFAFILMPLIFAANRYLKGFFKNTLLLWVILAGTAVYMLIFPYSFQIASTLPQAGIFAGFTGSFVFEPGVMLSFVICYFALMVNDIGSIQSVSEIVKPAEMKGRFKRGVVATGIVNVLSGISGVVGGVNYSTSAGIILESRCASRWTLVPAALILAAIGLFPQAASLICAIPPVITGCLLIYVLAAQFSASVSVFFSDMKEKGFDFDSGIIVGLSVAMGAIASAVPQDVAMKLPVFLQPLLPNGFVVGVLTVLVMEHLVYRGRDSE
ncbi:xanthine/uracil permease [Methanomicrobium sp. W14]|uniref:uracil-xanthine permease family protein n=1 Tax=Methanomicrobium sp. W14 TaxID=2817839 RepID=UPI001AEB4CD9|nr:solute carrier family 23 protein [Methanomicrobium sp. W14]MBP2134116.1 xanthine/uracil permease [Methanomicrobium sp. W14]